MYSEERGRAAGVNHAKMNNLDVSSKYLASNGSVVGPIVVKCERCGADCCELCCTGQLEAEFPTDWPTAVFG